MVSSVLVGTSRLSRLLAIAVAATAAVYARTAVGPLQEALSRDLNLSDNQMALLQGMALSVPVMLAVIPVGLLVDRRSRVRLMFIFLLLTFAGSVMTSVASEFFELFVARCLVGLSATATVTAAFSASADLCTEEERGRTTMLLAVGQYCGMATAYALGGKVFALLGGLPVCWRGSLAILTLPLGPVAILMLFVSEPQRTGIGIENPSASEILSELWGYRALIAPLLAGVVFAEVALGSSLTWAAPALARRFYLTPQTVDGVVAGGLVVSGILGPIVGGAIADFCQRGGGPGRTLSVLSYLGLLVIPASLFAFVPNMILASALLVAFLATGSAVGVMGTTLFTIVIPNELRGLCVATLFAFALFFSAGVAPLVVSVLSGALGGSLAIGKALAIVGSGASLLASATFTLTRRHVRCATLS